MHSYKVTSLVHIDPGRHIDIQTGNSVVCTIKNKKTQKKQWSVQKVRKHGVFTYRMICRETCSSFHVTSNHFWPIYQSNPSYLQIENLDHYFCMHCNETSRRRWLSIPLFFQVPPYPTCSPVHWNSLWAYTTV